MDNILLIICTVIYDPAATQSTFLQRVDQAKSPDAPMQVQRFLRVGVPLAIAFSPKDEIKAFLSRIPVETQDDDDGSFELHDDPSEDEAAAVSVTPTSKVMGFDTATLSEDQIKTLMLYGHAVEGTKQ
jgi:hypothetical protein